MLAYDFIDPPPPPPRTQHCLTNGSQERLRLRQVLSLKAGEGGGIELIRCVATLERWEAPAPQEASAAAAAAAAPPPPVDSGGPLSLRPRLKEADVAGPLKSFHVCAARLGGDGAERELLSYTTREAEEEATLGGPGAAADADGEGKGGGGVHFSVCRFRSRAARFLKGIVSQTLSCYHDIAPWRWAAPWEEIAVWGTSGEAA